MNTDIKAHVGHRCLVWLSHVYCRDCDLFMEWDNTCIRIDKLQLNEPTRRHNED